MTTQHLQALGLPETATDEEISARIEELNRGGASAPSVATERPPSSTRICETVSQARFPLELPPGVSREAVTYRMNALIDAGTGVAIAPVLALDAERGQMHRDALNAQG